MFGRFRHFSHVHGGPFRQQPADDGGHKNQCDNQYGKQLQKNIQVFVDLFKAFAGLQHGIRADNGGYHTGLIISLGDADGLDRMSLTFILYF